MDRQIGRINVNVNGLQSYFIYANHTCLTGSAFFSSLNSVVKRSCVIVPLFHPGMCRKPLHWKASAIQ